MAVLAAATPAAAAHRATGSDDMNKEVQLKQFTERFTKAFGANAVALILYGSAAGAEFNEHYSDFNLLCVLGRVGPDELAASEALFHWWMER